MLLDYLFVWVKDPQCLGMLTLLSRGHWLQGKLALRLNNSSSPQVSHTQVCCHVEADVICRLRWILPLVGSFILSAT